MAGINNSELITMRKLIIRSNPNAGLEADKPVSKKKKVFIVHGRDETLLKKVEKQLADNDLVPIVLHKQTSNGRNIIDNLEKHTEVKTAIVLYTPDDLGKFAVDKDLQARARQNVIFEHGFLLAKLGRERVIMMVDGDPELPTDVTGITYIHASTRGWRKKLCEELIDLKVLEKCEE